MSTASLIGQAAIDAENPWPGLSPFDEAAERFFNGRDAESADLLRLAGQAPLTILFGKSGLGKTSLVQAGLFPRLRPQNILPVYVRLDVRDRSAPLIEQAATALQAEIDRHGVDAPAVGPGESLWEHLHGRHVAWWSRRNQPLTPLFVFDQFEEVFTLGADNAAGIEGLRLDLADLIENRIPAALARRLEDGATAEHLDLRGQRYQVLLSFREDFLPEVEGWKRDVPSLMRNRLRLLPMSADRALQVVSGRTPTGRTHELVADETAREIVRFVAAVQSGDDSAGRTRQTRTGLDQPWDTLEIEPALLSLVCAGLNERRKARGQAAIDAALLTATGQAIIGDFYRGCVAHVPDKTRRFIEDTLITEGGFRNSYPLQDALDQGALTEPLLRELVDRRLLRIDHQLGTERVELIHDRLTDVVREHRDRERERIRARRQRRMWWAAGSVVVALLGVGALFFSLWQQTRVALAEVERQKSDAEAAKRRAENEKQRADAQAGVAVQETARAEAAKRDALRALEETTEAKKQEARAATTAERAAEAARAALREAVAGKLVMQSRDILEQKRAGGTEVALLLAAAGFRLQPNSEAFSGLQYALNATPGLVKVVEFPDPVVAVSPDRRTAVTALGTTLRLWAAATGQPRGAPLRGHATDVRSVAFSPDAKTLASGSADGTLRLWDAGTGQPRGAPLLGHTEDVLSLAFSPDGKTLASGSYDKTLRLWDAGTGQPRGAPLQGHTAAVQSLAFSPDGRTLASGSVDETLRLWDVATAQPRGAPLQGHTREVSSVAFSPDGRTLASGSANEMLRLWDVATGQPRGTRLQEQYTMGVNGIAFSPDGKTLVSTDGWTVRLWDADTGEPRQWHGGRHQDRVSSVAFSPDGKTLISSAGRRLHLWDASSDQPWGVPLQGHTGMETVVALSPDGKTLASGSYDKPLRLWDVGTGQPRGVPLQGHTEYVWSLAFSPDGKTLASGSYDDTLRLWDAGTGQARGAPLQGHTDAVASLAFTPDGKTLASGSYDKTLRLWDVGTGQPRGAPLQGHTERVLSVAFSPDGNTLASGSADKTVRLWDVGTGRPRGVPLRGHTKDVQSLAFSPDGKTLASGSADETLRLWDVGTGRPRGAPIQEDGAARSLAFSPDGKTLVSATWRLSLWDVVTGQPRGTPLEGGPGEKGFVFSPDSKTIFSGNSYGTLRWDAPAVWIDRVCAKLARNLSRAGWRKYVGEIPYVEQCPGLPVAGDKP